MKEHFLYYLRVALLAGVLLFILASGAVFAHPVSASANVNLGLIENCSGQKLAVSPYPAKQSLHEFYSETAAAP